MLGGRLPVEVFEPGSSERQEAERAVGVQPLGVEHAFHQSGHDERVQPPDQGSVVQRARVGSIAALGEEPRLGKELGAAAERFERSGALRRVTGQPSRSRRIEQSYDQGLDPTHSAREDPAHLFEEANDSPRCLAVVQALRHLSHGLDLLVHVRRLLEDTLLLRLGGRTEPARDVELLLGTDL